MRFQPRLLLLLLLLSLTLLTQLHQSAGVGHHRRPLHHSMMVKAGGRHSGSWRHGERWCRTSGRGGLVKLGGSGEDEESARLASRASALPAGSCYWIAAASVDELLWLTDNSRRRDTGCLCVLTGAGGPKNLRLHVSSCRRRLPYLCQLPRPTTPAARSAASTTPPTRAGVGSTTLGGVEYLADDAGDFDGMDETVDHAKFPMFPDPLPSKSSGGPDGHPVGWLPPWPASSTTPPPPTTRTTAATDAVGDNSTTSSSVGNEQLRLLMGGQRSEFVTLLVLYTIVGVICCVLLALCIVRCCRGYCGRAKIRYVKQVDADDIPRFMPSSWA